MIGFGLSSGVVPVRGGMCKTKMETSDALVPDHNVGIVAWTEAENQLKSSINTIKMINSYHL